MVGIELPIRKSAINQFYERALIILQFLYFQDISEILLLLDSNGLATVNKVSAGVRNGEEADADEWRKVLLQPGATIPVHLGTKVHVPLVSRAQYAHARQSELGSINDVPVYACTYYQGSKNEN